MKTNYYSKVVGNVEAQKKLSFFLESFEATSLFPNCLFIAPRGTGKSLLCEETGRALHNISKAKGITKPLVTINCSSIKNIETLFNQLFIPHVLGDKHITFFFDEASALKEDVMDYFLTILNPNSENKNKIRFGDKEIVIDFRKVTFLFATTRPNALIPDFKNRLEDIQLGSYSNNELAQIMQKSFRNTVKIDVNTLTSLASFTKSNPRTAIVLAGNVVKYCGINNRMEFTQKDVAPLIDVLGLYPLGLTKLEVEVLKAVSKEQSLSLTGLCARFGMGKAAMQDVETNLLRFNLLTIQGQRKITGNGLEYLENVK